MHWFNLRHSAAGLAAWMLLFGSMPALHAADDSLLTLEVRVLTSISSRGGTSDVQAELMRPLVSGREILMPAHSRLFGHVRRAKGVGIGLRRERAYLDLEFNEWAAPSGERQPIDATPLRIDNAREQVVANGRIQGILAASNPLGIARGMWFRPSTHLLKTPAGLGGATGTTWAKLTLGPIGAGGLLGARLLLTRLPEPEIDLPPGTEMTLRVHCADLNRSWGKLQDAALLGESLSEFLAQQPVQVRKVDGTATSDIINVALEGSATTVEAAFRSAGWTHADALSKSSFKQAYKAFTQRQGYAEAPVSKLYYEGRLPDLVFQKSLNSIAKRHHVRLWRVAGPRGEDLWLGAATHDVTVSFDRQKFGLLHKVDENVDLERAKLVGDLGFAGALAATAQLPRTLSLTARTRTDQALSVVFLQAPAHAAPTIAEPIVALSRVHKLARRLVLEGRQYLLRDNPYYVAFSVMKKLGRRTETVLAETNEVPGMSFESTASADGLEVLE